MLFNSYIYLLLFLPAVAVIYFFLANRKKEAIAAYWLIAASLFFYSFWNPIYLPLLLGSIIFNYFIGSFLQKSGKRKDVLVLGIGINLFALGYFKYADFFIENVNTIFAANIDLLNIVLPLAISFFTFQQIAYLVDSYKGIVEEHSFKEYVLFVTFFPQLIAGPIVHHKEMMPQFKALGSKLVNYENISAGLFLLVLGLFKKVVVADTFAVWASGGFDSTASLTFVEAWVVSLSYTLQLYFDFSGYTDMALGAARIFNIKLPLNFNSPYKAKNLQDFWRRWHMTLTRFLRDYIYIPFGGNRKGEVRTLAHIGAVFLLGGLWHGAAWTFVIWGALHAFAMGVLAAWRKINITLPVVLSWALTFLFVNFAWVFFRAETFDRALSITKSMFGGAEFVGVSLFQSMPTPLFSIVSLEIPRIFEISIWIIVSIGAVLFTRNSTELMEHFKPNYKYLAVLIAMALLALYSMNRVSEFIYFNF